MTADEPMSTPDSAAPCGRVGEHGPHDMPCDSGCQPDWHHDTCAIYGKCPGLDTLAPDSADDSKPTVDLRATDRILIDGGNPSLAEAIREQNCTCGSGPEPAELHDDPCPYWDGTYPNETPCSSPLDDDEQENVKSQLDLHLCPDCGHRFKNGRCVGAKVAGTSPVLCECNGLCRRPCPPDSTDDATVGERGFLASLLDDQRRTWDERHGPTPPADDANRAPVSGGLDEGEVEALAQVLRDLPTNPQHYARLILASDWLAARDAAWVEHLAAVEGERERRELILADRLATVLAERDTARREAGERIAVAIEAHPSPHLTRIYAARIARADAVTSDDGSGA